MYRIQQLQQSPQQQTSTTSQQSPSPTVGVTSRPPVALSISVTTASHANPPVPSPRLPVATPSTTTTTTSRSSFAPPSRIASASLRLASKGGITLPLSAVPAQPVIVQRSNSNGVMSTATTLHQQQTTATSSSSASASPVTLASRGSIALPRGVVQEQQQQPLHQHQQLQSMHPGRPGISVSTLPPPRGITLPAGVTRHGNVAAATIASGQQQQLQRRPVVTISSGPRASLAGSGGITLLQQPRPQSVPTVPPPTTSSSSAATPSTTTSANTPAPPTAQLVAAFNKNGVYSSAGRASVTAHQQIAARRTNSAPGNLAASASSSKSGGAKHTYRKVVGGKPSVPRSMSLTFNNNLSPQIFLDRVIQSRGYSTQNFCSLEGGYYCKPTLLQKASYGIRLVQAIRQSDAPLLESFLKCGISPNPCNAFGESVVHMVCRRGDSKMLRILRENNCSLQVTDDFGRTPLHDACWTAEPNFETVEMILNDDERLLHIVDCRGSSPLSYVKRDHWGKWITFFQHKIDVYWPKRDASLQGDEGPPKLCNEAPHSRPIPDPPHAIPLDVAQLIASGKMGADEYLLQQHRGNNVVAATPAAAIMETPTQTATYVTT